MERIGDSLSRGMDICSSKDGGAYPFAFLLAIPFVFLRGK
jgi:hypothetical protein